MKKLITDGFLNDTASDAMAMVGRIVQNSGQRGG